MSDRTRHALLLLHHHRPAEAERELLAHLAEHPHDGPAMALLSSARSAQGDHVGAIATARELVAQAPDDDSAHYHLAKALLAKGDAKSALPSAQEAVRLDPDDADNHAMVALAHHHLNDHQEALDAAERGLAIDPEHLTCLNIRGSELAGQRRFEEADQVTAKLLEVDPENAHSHSNTGWTKLRQGRHEEAMHHFREALRRDPDMESARLGMIEALKARYWLYRLWLRYVFWVGNLKPGVQTAFIIGIWVLVRVMGDLGERVPVLGAITTPLVVLYMLFAFSTWVITPLTNLLLRLNPFGRLVLDRNERTTSALTGLALLLAVVGVSCLLAGRVGGLALVGYGLLMMVPLASMLSSDQVNVRRFRVGTAALLAVVGAAGVFIAFSTGQVFNGPMMLFGVGAIAYQWITALFVRG